jgi:hypothetical protein
MHKSLTAVLETTKLDTAVDGARWKKAAAAPIRPPIIDGVTTETGVPEGLVGSTLHSSVYESAAGTKVRALAANNVHDGGTYSPYPAGV